MLLLVGQENGWSCKCKLLDGDHFLSNCMATSQIHSVFVGWCRRVAEVSNRKGGGTSSINVAEVRLIKITIYSVISFKLSKISSFFS